MSRTSCEMHVRLLERFTRTQREAMYDQCGKTRFPFGQYMHHLQQKECEFEQFVEKTLDEERELYLEKVLDSDFDCDSQATIGDGKQGAHTRVYTHATYCMNAPGWVENGLNYTDVVYNDNGGVFLKMSLFLANDDNAGIDWYFKTNLKEGFEKKGTSEPGTNPKSAIVCTDAVNPTADVTDECTRASSPPFIGLGLKYVAHFKNKNYFYRASVDWSMDSYCAITPESDDDSPSNNMAIHSYCTNNRTLALYWVMDKMETYFGINGCTPVCDGTINPHCCCANGKQPSQRSLCGDRCVNCESSC